MILFNETKQMTFDIKQNKFNKPIFLNEGLNIFNTVKSLSKEELAKTFKIKNKLLDEVYEVYSQTPILDKVWGITTYNGIAFKQIEEDTLANENYYEYLNENVFILSAMFGILKATDQIFPYRLDFNTKVLKDESLYNFWKEKVSNFILSQKVNSLLVLSSDEYTKVLDNKNILKNIKIYDLSFDGKAPSVTLKKIRGKILNYCILNKIVNYEELIKYSDEFCSVKSIENGTINIALKKQ